MSSQRGVGGSSGIAGGNSVSDCQGHDDICRREQGVLRLTILSVLGSLAGDLVIRQAVGGALDAEALEHLGYGLCECVLHCRRSQIVTERGVRVRVCGGVVFKVCFAFKVGGGMQVLPPCVAARPSIKHEKKGD